MGWGLVGWVGNVGLVVVVLLAVVFMGLVLVTGFGCIGILGWGFWATALVVAVVWVVVVWCRSSFTVRFWCWFSVLTLVVLVFMVTLLGGDWLKFLENISFISFCTWLPFIPLRSCC